MGTADATPAMPRARPKLDAHGVLLVSTSCSDRNAVLERGRRLLISYARTFFETAPRRFERLRSSQPPSRRQQTLRTRA